MSYDFEITKKLFELRDEKYAAFQAKLTPGIDENTFIGVRVPILRKLSKEYFKDDEHTEFMQNLPHTYYDENMLHGMLIENIKDYDECVRAIDDFLPYIDNWAVCDTMSPKILKKHKDELIVKIRQWTSSDIVYTYRFGVEMLMSHFLDDDFKKEYLEIPAKFVSDEYYINMMRAWYYATALAKQWDDTIVYLENKTLDKWTHNKTIQKARESYRITSWQKEYLKSLKQ